MCLYQVWSLLQLRIFFSDSYQRWSNTEMFAKKCNKTLFFQLLSGKYVFSFCIALKWIVVSFFFMWHRLRSDCFITKKIVTILDWDSENLFVQTLGNVCMFACLLQIQYVCRLMQSIITHTIVPVVQVLEYCKKAYNLRIH